MVLRIREEDAACALELPRRYRLRLMPEVPESPMLALVADSPLVIGRSPLDADYVAQFRPRGNANDARTRRIGRAQTYLQLRMDRLRIDEPEALNPSLVLETPMRQRAAVSLPTDIVIAGEYGLKIRLVSSVCAAGRQLSGWNGGDVSLMQGALTVLPESLASSLPCQAALVVSDVTLVLDSQGRPKFRAEGNPAATGRIHRFGGHYWWQDLLCEESNVELQLLKPGMNLKIGAVNYQVQAHDLLISGLCSEDTTLN